MKRIVAVLLTAILLLSCLPLSAAAKPDKAQTAAGVEAKFRLLLEDLELVAENPEYEYFYDELGQYPAKDPEWILFSGGLLQKVPQGGFSYQYAVFGNKLIRGNTDSVPFKLGYGVYDVRSGAFYDLIDAWNMNLNHLRDVWDGLTITDPYSKDENADETNMYTIGDADADGEVTILDATRIQRCIAELDENPWKDFAATGSEFIRGASVGGATDYDRDSDTTILDATRIQRSIAELPNNLVYRLAWDKRFFPSSGYDEDFDHSYLIDSLDTLDLSDSRFARDADFGAEQMIRDAYDDSFFKENSLLLLDISLASGSYNLTLSDMTVDRDGVLNVGFTYLQPNAATCDINDRFVCIEISKASADAIRDVKVNITPIRDKDYGYALVWDKKDSLYEGRGIASEMITAYDQLDPKNTYHAALIAKVSEGLPHPEDFFTHNAYLLANVPIGSTSYTIEGVDLAIDDDGILHIKLIAKGPQIGNAVVNTRFVCVGLSKDWLSECKGWQTELIFDFTTSDVNYRIPKLSSYNITNPGMKEIYLYNSLSDLNSGNDSHRMLIDKYSEGFFEDYALVAINYELPHSTLNQFFNFTVDGTVLKARILETKTNSDSGGTHHVWYVFEIKKSFIKGVQSVEIDHIVTEPAADNFKASDLTKATALTPQILGSNYKTLTFRELYTNSFSSKYEDTDNERYVGSKWYELKEQDPDLNGIVGVANDPNQLLSLWYDLPASDGAAWQYERFPSHCPYDLNFFRNYSVIAIVQRDDYSGKSLWIDNMYLKDGKLIVDATMKQTEEELVPRETYYVTLVSVYKQQLEGCSDIEVYGRSI